MSEEPLKELERCLRYVEETHRNIASVMSPELSHSFESFCRALAMRFPNYIEFAQPAQFWRKFRSAAKAPRASRSKRRRMEEGEDATHEEQESESDSDSELPLDRHKTAPADSRLSQRKTSCDMLVTELIFQPPDW
ncbi:GD15884 [Drosophila simulans]|nr:GD15884 [Drosophila simulans]